ncbi:MAG: hypothetical protein JXQ73_13455 [Phycisphaerae bacterium]|nr:hypothetical protein [Phycisphaerae bacterium]
MTALERLLDEKPLSPPLESAEASSLANELGALVRGNVYGMSLVGVDGWAIALARCDGRKRLVLVRGGESSARPPIETIATVAGTIDGREVSAAICEMSAEAAGLMRRWLDFASPRVLGTRRSFGAGDRLGLAGAGHIRACRQHGKGIAPVLAQQSARELTRTQRGPQEVIDAATWAAIQEGYREPWGADADHLKTPADVDAAAAAGFTMFTIDPGDHVDDHVDTDDNATLMDKYDALPWEILRITGDSLWHQYVGITYELGDGVNLVSETPEDLMKAACKYGRAIAHSVTMAAHIAEVMGGRPFEIEISVDETASPTSVFEHFFVANELKRLGVPNIVSMAPRFIGEFEKGIDYKGDLKAFEDTIRRHVVVARHCGPYKLSIHSGSDKFSIYPIVARHAGDLVHLKTAGTSYLEALRVIGQVDPDLFREIYAFSYDRYDEDRASYHVSADLSRLPKPQDLPIVHVSDLLNQNDSRQVFHVAFGSVLTAKGDVGGWRFRDRVLAALDASEEVHYHALVTHIGRHVAPFAVE